MGRVFLPQFKHHKNATVLDHAVDAERLDRAFSEVANSLNGGIDESNLADSTKFSAFSAAGAVATAIKPAYSLVTLRGHFLNSRYKATGHFIALGYLPSSYQCSLYRASIYGEDLSSSYQTFSILLGSSVGTGVEFTPQVVDYTAAGPVTNYTGRYPPAAWGEYSGNLVSASMPPNSQWAVVEAVFKVRVST
jgi:hypothetical protein